MLVPNASTIRSGLTGPLYRDDYHPILVLTGVGRPTLLGCDASLTDPPAPRGDILGVFEHYRLAAQANPAPRFRARLSEEASEVELTLV